MDCELKHAGCRGNILSPRTTLQDLLDVLSTILECGLLVVQSLFKVGDIFLECGRLVCETLVQDVDRNSDKPDHHQRIFKSGRGELTFCQPLRTQDCLSEANSTRSR